MTRLQPFAIALSCALSACAGSTLQTPTERDAARIRPQWPQASLSSLQEGRTLYQSRCSRCHRLYEPGMQSPQEWQVDVAKMRERAGLTVSDEEHITQYLIAIASRTAATDSASNN